MRTLRQTVQGHYRHDLRELQHSFTEMVSDFLSDFIIKEGYQFNGTVKDHRHYAIVGLVLVAQDTLYVGTSQFR